MNLCKTFITAATLSLLSTTAFAFPVDLDSVQGQWTNASGGQNVAGEGSSIIQWGTGHNRSGYEFTPNSSLPVTINDTTPFVLGAFTHHNNPIGTGSAIDSVDLDVYAGFSEIGGSTLTGPFTFNFQHNETPNNAPVMHCDLICKLVAHWFGWNWTYTTHDGAVDDIVRVSFDQSMSSEFVLGSNAYSLNLLGFEGNASELYTPEHKKTSVNLLASLSVRQVPEPGTLALLSLGLIGLGLARRRRLA